MEPIVFVPGLLCTEVLYAPQLGAFSDHPVMIGEHRRHDSIAGIATAILEAAPQRFALVGLSMGGYIAMEIMRQAPERVSRLALLDTAATPDTPEQTERRRQLIALAEGGKFDRIVPALYPSFVHANRRDDAVLRSTVEEMAAETGPEAFIRQQTAIMNRVDSRPGLAAIGCPTLVLVGDGDTLTPPEKAAEIHSLVSGSRLEIVADCGHLSTLERPEAVTQALKAWVA